MRLAMTCSPHETLALQRVVDNHSRGGVEDDQAAGRCTYMYIQQDRVRMWALSVVCCIPCAQPHTRCCPTTHHEHLTGTCPQLSPWPGAPRRANSL